MAGQTGSWLRWSTPQSGNQVLTFLDNSRLYWTIFARNRDTAVPAEGNGNSQTLICVLTVRLGRCPTLSNLVLWQSWIAAYLGYTLQMKMLFPGWPIMVHGTHKRKKEKKERLSHTDPWVECYAGLTSRVMLKINEIRSIVLLPPPTRRTLCDRSFCLCVILWAGLLKK